MQRDNLPEPVKVALTSDQKVLNERMWRLCPLSGYEAFMEYAVSYCVKFALLFNSSQYHILERHLSRGKGAKKEGYYYMWLVSALGEDHALDFYNHACRVYVRFVSMYVKNSSYCKTEPSRGIPFGFS